jgi:hypothetical protein
MKSNYYFEALQEALLNPDLTVEDLQETVQKTELFLRVLRVKLESREPELRTQAAQELNTLKTLLHKRLLNLYTETT